MPSLPIHWKVVHSPVLGTATVPVLLTPSISTWKALVVYSLVDAYVDAHFRNFKIEFETDPALPQGAKGAAARVAWELRF